MRHGLGLTGECNVRGRVELAGEVAFGQRRGSICEVKNVSEGEVDVEADVGVVDST